MYAPTSRVTMRIKKELKKWSFGEPEIERTVTSSVSTSPKIFQKHIT